MNGKTIIASLLTAALFLVAASARADVGAGITLERLGMLSINGSGARPFSMGNAYTSVSDDVYALLFNPAGLAQMKQKELSFGLNHARRESRNDYLGMSAEQTGSYTSLGHLALTYPYPMYSGGLVFGFGIFRVGSSDLESLRNGHLSELSATSQNLLTQSGNIYQYHIGIGVDVSPSISLGASLVLWDESIDFTEQIVYEDPGSLAVYTDDVSLDMDGLSLNLGLMIRLYEDVRIGLLFTSPTWISYYGEGVTNYEGTYYVGPYEGWTSDPYYALIDEDYTLPMQLRGGISARIAYLLLSADVSYIDYSQTKKNGQRLVDDFSPGRPNVLDAVWNLHAGAELAVPNVPLWLRGGYSYMPLSLPTIEEIVFIENDELVAYVGDAEIVRERHIFSFGAGVLIDQIFMIDAAVAFGSYERDTGYLVEERKATEIVLSGTYRF
jgi:long-subunit fatty acid transport protein